MSLNFELISFSKFLFHFNYSHEKTNQTYLHFHISLNAIIARLAYYKPVKSIIINERLSIDKIKLYQFNLRLIRKILSITLTFTRTMKV